MSLTLIILLLFKPLFNLQKENPQPKIIRKKKLRLSKEQKRDDRK